MFWIFSVEVQFYIGGRSY